MHLQVRHSRTGPHRIYRQSRCMDDPSHPHVACSNAPRSKRELVWNFPIGLQSCSRSGECERELLRPPLTIISETRWTLTNQRCSPLACAMRSRQIHGVWIFVLSLPTFTPLQSNSWIGQRGMTCYRSLWTRLEVGSRSSQITHTIREVL